MSGTLMAKVLKRSTAKTRDRMVLTVIAQYADPDGTNAWPSLETIAVEAGMSVTTVKLAIADLVALGELEVKVKAGGPPGKRNDQRPNLYTIHLHDRSAVSRRKRANDSRTGDRREEGNDSRTGDRRDETNDSRNRDERQSESADNDSRTGDYDSKTEKSGKVLLEEPQTAPPIGDAEKSAASLQKKAVRDALAEACGIDLDKITKTASGALGRAVKELIDVGADPDEVRLRAKRFFSRFPNVDSLTPSALVKHWASLNGKSIRPPEESNWFPPPESKAVSESYGFQLAFDPNITTPDQAKDRIREHAQALPDHIDPWEAWEAYCTEIEKQTGVRPVETREEKTP